jgi:FkbM family methyltransferase
LHTIIMDRCGYQVTAFEPDPIHFEILIHNLELNGVRAAELRNSAVSVADGQAIFVRVQGNTTGSHLLGSKDSYGERQQLTVPTHAAQPLFSFADLIKVDAEGHERQILLATSEADWNTTDAIVEVGNEANANAIYQHLTGLGVNLFAQKKGWGRVVSADEVPTSHRQGSLFITRAQRMPWPAA